MYENLQYCTKEILTNSSAMKVPLTLIEYSNTTQALIFNNEINLLTIINYVIFNDIHNSIHLHRL